MNRLIHKTLGTCLLANNRVLKINSLKKLRDDSVKLCGMSAFSSNCHVALNKNNNKKACYVVNNKNVCLLNKFLYDTNTKPTVLIR